MTKTQKLQFGISETRTAINKLIEKRNGLKDGETLPESWAADMNKAAKQLDEQETEFRAELAIESSGQLDDEGRELQSMKSRSNLGRFFDAVLEQRSLDGVEKELQDLAGVGNHVIPLAALETRAVSTPPATGNIGVSQQPILPYIFPATATAFLGISQPSVGVGEVGYPMITSKATVHSPAKAAAAGDTTGEFSVVNLKPKRLQASFFWNREDAAIFAGMESSLRETLVASLGNELDTKTLTGASDEGLLTGALTEPDNPGAQTNYQAYVDALYNQVDGRYASATGEVRMLVGADTLRHAAKQSQAQSGESGAAALTRLGGGLQVSNKVPAIASKRQDALVARMIGGSHAVAPIWEGVSLIRDEITKAGAGQILIHAVMLYSFGVIRSAAFARLRFQVTA